MRIKVLCSRARRTREPFEYTPGYVFTTDPACRDYDWLVVYDEMPCDREELACPRAQTILMTSEPTSIKSYSRAYTRQFGHLLTNRPQSAECHPHWHLGHGYYFWFNGRDYAANCRPVAVAKDKVVSACISSKQMRHTQHASRYALMTALVAAVPGLDWFGRGVRAFGQKYEVLDPYQYHVVIENHVAPHHWSEKIADAFLCECLPFYAGDPLLAEDFPSESFIPIPLDDPSEAARIIRSAIASGEYARRRDAVLEAKRRILTKYNFWAQTLAVIAEASASSSDSSPGGVIYGRHALRWRSPSALIEDGWSHLRQYMRFGL